MSRTLMIALLTASIGAGCVAASDPVPLPRGYVDYKAYLIEQFDHALHSGSNAALPGPLKFAYESCAADAVLSTYTEQQRAKLDAYARREIVLTAGELKDINAAVRGRYPNASPEDLYRAMAPFCPNDIPTFRQYIRYGG